MGNKCIGLDIGNSKIKVFIYDCESRQIKWCTCNIDHTGFTKYDRSSNFERYIRNLLIDNIGVGYQKKICSLVAGISSGYSYQTFSEGVKHTASVLKALLPKTNTYLFTQDTSVVLTSRISSLSDDSLQNFFFTNSVGTAHLAKRLTPPFFSGLVLDMGGSTTAVFQLINGKIIPPDSKVSQTHYKRIQSGRLIWIGTQTTPLEYLLKEVRIKGNKFHVIPRGVTFQSISTLLELLSTELSNQLSLFGALGSKKDAIRAIADTIDMDSTFFSTKEWQDIANQFYVAAIDLLSVEIRKAKKGFSKCKQAIVFGLGGETLCMPALMKTGIKKENIHIAKLLISEEMAIMSSAYGACHKATELFLKRRLPPVLSHN